jgi:hypothetical protein
LPKIDSPRYLGKLEKEVTQLTNSPYKSSTKIKIGSSKPLNSDETAPIVKVKPSWREREVSKLEIKIDGVQLNSF